MSEPFLSGDLLALAMGICVLGSAFFSGTETGLLTVSRVRLQRLAKSGEARVDRVLRLVDRLEDGILACLVGTNLFNILASALMTAALTARLGERGEGVAVAITATLLVIFGEIVPKVLYREYPERLTVASEPVLRGFMVLVAPLRWLLNGYARLVQRLSGRGDGSGGRSDPRGLFALLETAAAGPGPQDRTFQAALDRFLRLSGRRLDELMRPWSGVVVVDSTATLGETLDVAARSGFSRLPVIGRGPEDVVGYLLVRDLLFRAEEEDADLAAPAPPASLRPALLVDAAMSPYELFEELHSQGVQLAVVVDQQAHPVGLLTLEDLIEKVTGSISDEFDAVASGAA